MLRAIYPDLGLCAYKDGGEDMADDEAYERLELRNKTPIVALTA